MGTFDEYAGEVPCPRCGDIHLIYGQTKFFDPFGVMRYFQPGLPQDVDITPAQVDDAAHPEWWRVRDRANHDDFTLLVDFDDMFRCDCELAIAPLLHFAVAPGRVTLERIELLDGRQQLADRVDFACSDRLPDSAAVSALAARPYAERAAALHGWLAERFAAPEDDLRSVEWTTLVGPTQCEACGDVRERTIGTMLSRRGEESWFGPGWTGGVIFLGDRVPFDDRWLADDTDRGAYFRARHPVGDPIAVLSWRWRIKCRCGHGPVRALARFARHPGALELVELTLRAVAGRDDLAGIDFIEGELRSALRDRERVLAWVAGSG